MQARLGKLPCQIKGFLQYLGQFLPKIAHPSESNRPVRILSALLGVVFENRAEVRHA